MIKQMSIMITTHFFLATDGLKEEEHLKNMMMQIIQYLNLKKINI